MSDYSAATLLAGWSRRVSRMYAMDLKALPAEAYTAVPGDVARSPQDFTAEVAGMTSLAAKVVRGEAVAPPEEGAMASYAATLDTAEKGAAAVVAAGDELADALEANPGRLAEGTMAPWGEPMSVGDLANIAANHIMYHDGQLTLIQMLNGDEKMHWFDAS